MWKNVQKYNFIIRFVLSAKDKVVGKLKDNYKKLVEDLENQKGIKKKLEETVNEYTKQYNELVKSFSK